VERQRLQTDFIEEHRSPFSGVVNAVYITKGAHVKSGTTLMEVLDCSKPVVIVPIRNTGSVIFQWDKK
jgi:multidrug resistance efflux pump